MCGSNRGVSRSMKARGIRSPQRQPQRGDDPLARVDRHVAEAARRRRRARLRRRRRLAAAARRRARPRPGTTAAAARPGSRRGRRAAPRRTGEVARAVDDRQRRHAGRSAGRSSAERFGHGVRHPAANSSLPSSVVLVVRASGCSGSSGSKKRSPRPIGVRCPPRRPALRRARSSRSTRLLAQHAQQRLRARPRRWPSGCVGSCAIRLIA